MVCCYGQNVAENGLLVWVGVVKNGLLLSVECCDE